MQLITKNTGCASPLKVAVIEPSGRLYGSEYCLLDIIDGLPHSSYDWQVFLPQGAGFDRLLLDRGIDCQFLIPRDLGERSLLKKSIVYLRILWRLRQLKPDLLYVNQTGSLRSASLFAKWLKLPVVCQVQTLEDARWLSERRELHDDVQAFICNSEFIANETHCDAEKKCLLYQGLPAIRAERAIEFGKKAQYKQKSRETFSLGILGRIAASKGHYLLVEAAEKLAKILPNFQIVVIGEGLKPDDTQAFVQRVESAGLGSVFEFRGYRQDLEQELSRLDLLVIPSLAEPLGRVLFDAAEFAVPVVLSEAGGLGEISSRFDVGVSFESGNAEALANTLLAVLKNYDQTAHEFRLNSQNMLKRLCLTSYLSSVDRILQATARRLNSSEIWLGDKQLEQ